MAIITASPKNLQRLIELTEASNEHLLTIRKIMEDERSQDGYKEVKGTSGGGKVLAEVDDKQEKREEELLKIQEEQLELAKKADADRKEQLEKINKVSESLETAESVPERMLKSIKEFGNKFKPEKLKDDILKATNILGINNMKIAERAFSKRQRALGSEKSDKELAADFKVANQATKEMRNVESSLDDLKKQTGLNDEQIAQTKKGSELLAQKNAAAGRLSSVDLASSIAAGNTTTDNSSVVTNNASTQNLATNNTTINPASIPLPSASAGVNMTPTSALAKNGSEEEAANENAKIVDQQMDLLVKIEENTRGGGLDQKAKNATSETGSGGGGILAGIGGGLKALGGGLKSLGAGVGKGIQALLTGIAKGIGAFGNGQVLKGSAAMLVLGGALWVVSDALEKFTNIGWDDMGKALVALLGLGAVAAVAGMAAPLLITGAAAIGAVGLALLPFAAAMAIAGPAMDQFASGMERLSSIDGGNLIKVGEGLLAVSAGMVAFGAAQAVAGVGNLVGNFLSFVSGGKSPIDQIKELAQYGENIQKAGDGVEKLGKGLQVFSSIDTDKIKAIAALPTEKIAAMGAAMGKMQQTNQVYNQSAQNAGQSGGTTNQSNQTVVAPTTINKTTQNAVIKSPIRNQDSTINGYIKNRAVAF